MGAPCGHSNGIAAQILCEELEKVVADFERKERRKSWKERLFNSFLHHNDAQSVFHWTNTASVIVIALFLVVAFLVQTNKDGWLLIEAFLLLGLTLCNVILLQRDYNLRQVEVLSRIKTVIQDLKRLKNSEKAWDENDYVDLHVPLSPCVTLQWTYRDGVVRNIPWALLVAGDVIMLRPGQVVPAACQILKPESGGGPIELKQGEMFNPGPHDEDVFYHPKARIPLKATGYRLIETPFLKYIDPLLQSDRPTSVLNQERYIIYSRWIEKRVVPIVLCVLILTNSLRYVFFTRNVGHWADMFIVLPVQGLLPMLPLIFPLLWRFFEYYGTARVMAAYSKARDAPIYMDSFSHESDELKRPPITVSCKDALKRLIPILKGSTDGLARSVNLAHVLGNVTSFCCVDKKGVLSWPNPTPEKVFFLHNKYMSAASLDSTNDDYGSQESFLSNDGRNMQSTEDLDIPQESSFEVLDLTQDARDGKSIQFDDPSWKRYLCSLKPLGLNILLNTCNLETLEQYTSFADHITCASLKREQTVPVINRSDYTIEALSTVRRRCFCELARQIGFSQQAMDIFKLQHVLGMYRQVDSDPAIKERAGKRSSHIRYKLPMPYMFSVVAKEVNSGMCQLMSQGTADLLLDTCSDYWNGNDLCPLTEADRKKIADFYHRTSMSSYCTAFSYRPLDQTIGAEFSNYFIEIPDQFRMSSDFRTPTPSKCYDSPSADALKFQSVHHYGSADSLIIGSSQKTIHDVGTCFKAQCNQIFIGMIAMQYQAKLDIIQLIEELDSACIRFVHFSKENELRSRVFSEKMGLEAGWNCHISLLSEKTTSANTVDALSPQADVTTPKKQPTEPEADGASQKKVSEFPSRRCSAPGLISAEMSQVKFESDLPTVIDSTSSTPTPVPLDSASIEPDDKPRENDALLNHRDRSPASHREVMTHSSSKLSTSDKSKKNKSISFEDIKDHSSRGQLSESGSHDQRKSRGEYNMLSDKQQKGDGYQLDSEEEGEIQGLDASSSMDSIPASSYVTENTDSVGGLGLSNRAKLPKGIENIRPHIENVDNVPLLVSLFTDCTPETTREMFKILQEYGEVICCLGSSANLSNIGLFLQADCSVSIDPLHPQVCMRQNNNQDVVDQGPVALAAKLQRIPCSINLSWDDGVSMMELFLQARHHCQSVRNAFMFMLMLQITVSVFWLCNCVFLLPPALATHHLMWLVLVVAPLIGLTLMWNPVDREVMKMALRKNKGHLPLTLLKEFIGFYLIRFLPSIFVCLFCHGLILVNFCDVHLALNQTCLVFFGGFDDMTNQPGEWNGWQTIYAPGLTLSQNFVTFQMVLYFALISLSFVHRLHHLWNRSPLVNRVWCITVPSIIVCQIVYFTIDVIAQNFISSSATFHLKDVPIVAWVIALVWPLCLVSINELVKRREIRWGM